MYQNWGQKGYFSILTSLTTFETLRDLSMMILMHYRSRSVFVADFGAREMEEEELEVSKIILIFWHNRKIPELL